MFIGNANMLGRRTDGSIVYLLDTYSAAAAYSLRQLKTGVTNVVRVRRSSDNAESDFTATEITDGTLTTWTGANNGFVVTWYDQSGNSNDVFNTIAANQWQLVSSGSVLTENSLPTINTLTKSPSAFTSSIDIETAFFVSRLNSYNTVNYIMGNSSEGFFTGGTTGGVNGLGGFDGSTARSATGESLVQRLDYISMRGANIYTATDGASETDLGTINTITSTHLGGRPVASTTYFYGKLQEVILFTTDESANRTAIESDIDTHYWGADLLLDTYTGAAAAYSLRKLSKFTTNVVRVRRSSDNAESDFTADEITDGTLTTWTGANDGFVVTWYDQSGNGNNVTMSTAANQGKIVSSGSVINENGKPCVQMDGTNDRYASVSSVTGSLAKSVISVSNITNTNARIYTFNDNNRGLRNTSGDNLTIRGSLDVDITVVGSGSSRGQTLIESYRAGGSNTVETFYDSSTGGSAVTGSYNDGTLTWGADLSAALPMSGTIQELIISETDHKANRTAIESDINTYYSIY